MREKGCFNLEQVDMYFMGVWFASAMQICSSCVMVCISDVNLKYRHLMSCVFDLLLVTHGSLFPVLITTNTFNIIYRVFIFKVVAYTNRTSNTKLNIIGSNF